MLLHLCSSEVELTFTWRIMDLAANRYILLNENFDISQCNLTVLGSLAEGICCTPGWLLLTTV